MDARTRHSRWLASRGQGGCAVRGDELMPRHGCRMLRDGEHMPLDRVHGGAVPTKTKESYS